MEKVLVSWSSGKDSALALHQVMDDPAMEVVALLTTISSDTNRVSMHTTRLALVEQQAHSLGLPLVVVRFAPDGPPDAYGLAMRDVLAAHRDQGVSGVVFGDIFLDELRQTRESKLAQAGMRGVFPLWKRDTRELAQEMVALGYRAITTCVDTAAMGPEFLGRFIDDGFLAELPATADPCGENGEYHSFVCDGPRFQAPIAFTLGEVTSFEERYFYRDLVPGAAGKEA